MSVIDPSRTELPVLDVAAFRADPSSPEASRFVDELRAACHGPGFVYLTGHGIDPALEDGLWSASRAFFQLSEDERRSLAIVNSPAFRGYTILGDERTQGRSDWRDQIDLGPEQDAPPAGSTGPAWLRLRGPNQWPPSLPSMKPAVLDWMHAMDALGLTMLRALAVGLGQPIARFDADFTPESDVHLKIIRYPAQQAEADTGQGVGLHHDSGLLSFILQDDVGGLKVQLGDRLVDAEPIPGTYVMNLGEMLQTATSGYLRATPHMVESPPPGVERLSVAYFYNPRFESTFEPLQLPLELAAEAPGGEHGMIDDPVHSLFGENNLKIRLRAHPDVAARHYADVTRANVALDSGD
ncbi:MAG: isopenicillin N synthase family dioxygenase [Acidimicrobiales bacterium]